MKKRYKFLFFFTYIFIYALCFYLLYTITDKYLLRFLFFFVIFFILVKDILYVINKKYPSLSICDMVLIIDFKFTNLGKYIDILIFILFILNFIFSYYVYNYKNKKN